MNAAIKPAKRLGKQDREHQVLMGLVELYLRTGKPVGSNTLKEMGFEDFSSATLRNYFSHLEEEGYLTQQHSSGGRIPTHKAYRAYATAHKDSTIITPEEEQTLQSLRQTESREIASYLQNAADTLSSLTKAAVFLSAPRFDQDYIVGLKLVPIDHRRSLCVIVTDFGVIRTEILPTDMKLSAFSAKRIEHYFHWRLTGLDKPEDLDPEEQELAQRLYNELVIRYIVGYSNFVDAELYRTGLSKLLAYSDFHDASVLSSSLSLFENAHNMRLLVKECCKFDKLKYWIGEDLSTYSTTKPDCTVIAVPYYINQNTAGAVGILGPTRIPYRETFGILKEFSSCISEALTRNLYKFKITFRQPHGPTEMLQQEEYRQLLLEDKYSKGEL